MANQATAPRVVDRGDDAEERPTAPPPLPPTARRRTGVFRPRNLIVAAVAFVLASRSGGGRELREKLTFLVPLLGGLRRLYLDVESSRTMATLLRGGAPLTVALAVAADGTENTIYRRRLRRVRDLVSEGNSLHKSLEVTELMDSMGLEMVEVGESTGMLEEMLGHVALVAGGRPAG